MSSAASVEEVLSKITKHNADVLGCLAAAGDKVYSDLPSLYEMVDVENVIETATNMFRMADQLETGHAPFDQVFLEFESHSFFARQIDQGLLVLVNRPTQRGSFKKLQLGINLFLKPLERALAAEGGLTERSFVEVERKRPNPLRRVFGHLV